MMKLIHSFLLVLASLFFTAVPDNAEARINCGNNPVTGKRIRTQMCKTVEPATLKIVNAAFTACGEYFVKDADISQLLQKGFVRKHNWLQANVQQEKYRQKVEVSVRIKEKRRGGNECFVNIYQLTAADGKTVFESMLKNLTSYGFKKKQAIANGRYKTDVLAWRGKNYEYSFLVSQGSTLHLRFILKPYE